MAAGPCPGARPASLVPGNPNPHNGALVTLSAIIVHPGGSVLGTSSAPAKVAELVDALDLESSGAPREGSTPSFRTRPIAPSRTHDMQVSLTATGGLERRLEV